jgi:hypothetical protein
MAVCEEGGLRPPVPQHARQGAVQCQAQGPPVAEAVIDAPQA